MCRPDDGGVGRALRHGKVRRWGGDGCDLAAQVRGRLPAGGDRRDDGAWYGGGQLQVLPEDLQ